ncbi:MAG TPA: LLM class flavin-dependent oxidoreductase [Acidimicrobiales bacterium]|nr:LLM class flavin-dependent oxidoreductase [Acidimicrobiales bacterium]
MRFGIFYEHQLPRPWGPDDEHRLLLNALEQVELADRLGIDYVWEVEHHFLEEYSHSSAPEVFLAAVSQRTKRIKLGHGIVQTPPPFNHPARIAERVAMIDHLSEGRFEFGTGRGSSTTEQRGFGIEDPELTREMVAETLPEIVRMWKEEDYSYDGKFFSMPPRNVLPKPFTNPHPPLWVAAGSPSTFELAARQGLGVLCFAFGPPEGFIPLIEKYKKDIENCDPVGGYVNNNVMITTQMLCLEDGGRARQVMSDMDTGYYISLVFRYLDTFPRPPGIPEWPQTIPDSTPEQIDKQIKDRQIAVGDPDEVRATIQRFADTGADQLSFGMLSSSMDIEICEEAVATFGKHVLPQFDTDPVHSTTRQREAQLGS